jgi:peptidoglycan/xylan/chitin deacetylase (PgdA/CDA1 family)
MILTYHNICRNSEVPDVNSVTEGTFLRQMKSLKKLKVVTFREYKPDNPKHVVVTFDDGYKSVVTLALPILKRLGYRFEVFLVGNFLGTPGFMNESDCCIVCENGGELQWHTKSHPKLPELTCDDINAELTIPEEIRRLDPNGFYALAYPYWVWNLEVISSARNYGFTYGRSGNGYGFNSKTSSPDCIEFVNQQGLNLLLDSFKILERTSIRILLIKTICKLFLDKLHSIVSIW